MTHIYHTCDITHILGIIYEAYISHMWHNYDAYMSHMWYNWVMSHVWYKCVIYNESCHIFDTGETYSHVYESRHMCDSYKWVMSCIIWMRHTLMCMSHVTYGVALVSRIYKIIGLFRKRDNILQKETYNLIDPADCSHSICDIYASHIWVMSYRWDIYSCAWVTSHMWKHVRHITESCHRCDMDESCGHVHESRHICDISASYTWVMLYIWQRWDI